MKIIYEIDKTEPDFKKRRVQDALLKVLASKIAIRASEVHVDQVYEPKVLDILSKSGLKFKKIA